MSWFCKIQSGLLRWLRPGFNQIGVWPGRTGFFVLRGWRID